MNKKKNYYTDETVIQSQKELLIVAVNFKFVNTF